MLSVAHTLISLPLGVYLEHPLIIFTSAFLVHMLSDTLLHWNIYPHDFKRYPALLVAADVFGGLALAWLLIGNTVFTSSILIAIAGGNTPDILHGLWDLYGKRKKRLSYLQPFFTFHHNLQLETKNVWRGLVWQITLCFIAILIVI